MTLPSSWSLNGNELMVVEEGKFNVTLTYTKADGTQADLQCRFFRRRDFDYQARAS